MKFYPILFAILTCQIVYAQNTFKAVVKDDKTKLPLPGATATITSLNLGRTADTSGQVTINNVPDGRYQVRFSFVGYLGQDKTIIFPLKNPDEIMEIFLERQSGELAEVTIQTTRTNQNLRDIPTRIEALP